MPRRVASPELFYPMSEPVPLTTPAAHAWSTVPRQEPAKRLPTDRTGDFREIYAPFDENMAREQASRCIQCPNPLCVTGCPLHLQIPEWLGLVADGQFAEAAAVLQTTGTLPEICARVCPADRLCEAACLIGERAAPVAIWALEQFLNEYAFEHGIATATTAPLNGWRVAVIGATLGGVACASELARRGYMVTLIDHGSIANSLAREAPAFRLDPAVAERRLRMLILQGVEFRGGALVGRTEIEAQFDGVYLAMATTRSRRLDIPGMALKGVGLAMPFISHHAASAPATRAYQVRGKRVTVIGGGETALDCLRTALRAGARQAIGVYRREEAAMPCGRREYENAIEEGAVYVFGATPVAILGNENNEVTGIRLARTDTGPAARTRGLPVVCRAGTEFDIATDGVFLALGCESKHLSAADPFSELADATGIVSVDNQQMTSVPGVFAGGSLVRGPCTSLESVHDARRAAAAIDSYLTARTTGAAGNPP